jgi:hypothetical protein
MKHEAVFARLHTQLHTRGRNGQSKNKENPGRETGASDLCILSPYCIRNVHDPRSVYPPCTLLMRFWRFLRLLRYVE